MTQDDLDLVPLDDLLAAFLRRHDYVVVVVADERAGAVNEEVWAYKGDFLKLVGLLESVKQRVLAARQEARI